MAKPDKNKKQKITRFDFSGEGSHVALVDKAANGKEKFLVMKSLASEVEYNQERVADLQEQNSRLTAAMDNTVEVPLAELLNILGLWQGDALMVSELVAKNEDGSVDEEATSEAVKSYLKELEGSLAASSAKEEVSEDTSVSKSENGETMAEVEKQEAAKEELKVDEPVKTEVEVAKSEEGSQDLEAVMKELNTLKDELAVFKGVEEARVEKKFEDLAVTYKDLGLEAEDGKVLRVLKGLEGSEKIFKALDSALEFVNKEVEAKEKGSGLQDEAVTAVKSDDINKNYDKLRSIAKSMQKLPENEGKSLQELTVEAAKANPELRG